MKIKEYINKKLTQKCINETMCLLKNEFTISYGESFVTADEMLFQQHQQYAEILYNLLDYYKDKNLELCELVLGVTSQFGEKVKRYNKNSTSFLKEDECIRLLFPQVIKNKIDMLNKKMEKDKKAEVNGFAKKIDVFVK